MPSSCALKRQHIQTAGPRHQRVLPTDDLSRPQNQDTALSQRLHQPIQYLPPRRLVEVDQDVLAINQVHAARRGASSMKNVELGKADTPAQAIDDAELAVEQLFGIAAAQLGRDLLVAPLGIECLSRRRQR